jgi:hypothetical protein
MAKKMPKSNSGSSLSGMKTNISNDTKSTTSSDAPVTETFYTIRCAPYLFVAVVKRVPIQRCDYIVVGGRDRCVHLCVYWDDDVAHLQGLRSNENCSVDGDMQHGHGTRKMMMASLKFLCSLYVTLTGVTFRDTSCLTCHANKTLPLHIFHIAKYKKTWYQDKLGAIPYDNETYFDALRALNARLDEPKTMSFDEFYTTYMTRNFRPVIKNDRAVFEPVYVRSRSLREFIKTILAEYHDCLMFYKWFPNFMSKLGASRLLLEHMLFSIGRNAIDDWDTEINVSVTQETPFSQEPEQITTELQHGGYDPFTFRRGAAVL